MAHLQRVLSLWDLVFYGIILIEPIAAVPLFGIGQELSRGHMVTTVLVGMVAMMLTASSYGRLAAPFPSAGSAYTYVSKTMNPHIGFLAGWVMALGYLVLPLINVIFVVVAVQREFPVVPYWVGAAGFAALITLLNLAGIRWTARANQALLFVMGAVIVAFIALAIRLVVRSSGFGGLFSTLPIYNPQEFRLKDFAAATSFATLTYVGFDGVTTLAEDVENPRRNAWLATILVVAFTGAFSALQVYLAQLVLPGFHFAQPETAFMDVCSRVGGMPLYHAMWVILLVASFGSALTGQVGAARILYGMGRDNALPHKLFARLNPKRNTPTANIMLVGFLAFVGSALVNYERGGEILNSGAFLAFMAVNAAAFWHFYVKNPRGQERRWFADGIAPALGLLFCLAIWLSLPKLAMTVGALWLLGGILLSGWKTRGFRERPVLMGFGDSYGSGPDCL